VSRTRLATRRSIPKANGPVLLDSGAFTELQRHGRWTITAAEYVAEVRRYIAAIGPEHVEAISPQDWMCEPIVINGGTTKDGPFAGTGLSVVEHQLRTVTNLVELRRLAPDLPIIPVIQGYDLADYARCVALYQAAGVNLRAEPLVGLGSVCRRQASGEIDLIVSTLQAMGIALHGFGVKAEGLAAYGPLLESADSQAWSYAARRRVGRCPHGRGIRWEANCPAYALTWWRSAVARSHGDAQLAFDLTA
jgi:hypothetical protein